MGTRPEGQVYKEVVFIMILFSLFLLLLLSNILSLSLSLSLSLFSQTATMNTPKSILKASESEELKLVGASGLAEYVEAFEGLGIERAIGFADDRDMKKVISAERRGILKANRSRVEKMRKLSRSEIRPDDVISFPRLAFKMDRSEIYLYDKNLGPADGFVEVVCLKNFL